MLDENTILQVLEILGELPAGKITSEGKFISEIYVEILNYLRENKNGDRESSTKYS